ncbi:SubName: Full=Related to TY3B-TY3B protein {ECO:0000313/EMBL:CCA76064.1} [Serendipita indica DSM 11827]|nr:SubName: Full=Related to TY3B-TY3B protein {ECO:0000313/EMBL:CCA76064.1} [Serendipita indica DSM 11827]
MTQPDLTGLASHLTRPSINTWQAIGIDFVGPLPSSSNRSSVFDMICVVIDHLTSMVHLVPMRQNYTAKNIAEMVFENVYKLHDLPERIISDRDSYFTSTFWSELHRIVGVELRLSTSYHPQTDGATERANRTMITMLRQAVEPHQKDWVSKLPSIEFAMNSARSAATGYAPFFLNSGQMPRPMIWTAESDYPGVQKHAEAIRDAIMSAHDSILAARVKHTTEANKHRKPAPFAEGDLVYLSTQNLSLPKKRARKLVPKFIGPFRISKVIEPGATYRLELPDELRQRGIHNSFHASLLRFHVPNDDRKFPGRSLQHVTGFGKPSHWPVDRIVSHYGTGKRAIFEVLWKSGDKSWEMYSTVKDLTALEAYCEAQGIGSVSNLRKGTGNVPNDPQTRYTAASIKVDELLTTHAQANLLPSSYTRRSLCSTHLESTMSLSDMEYATSDVMAEYPEYPPNGTEAHFVNPSELSSDDSVTFSSVANHPPTPMPTMDTLAIKSLQERCAQLKAFISTMSAQLIERSLSATVFNHVQADPMVPTASLDPPVTQTSSNKSSDPWKRLNRNNRRDEDSNRHGDHPYESIPKPKRGNNRRERCNRHRHDSGEPIQVLPWVRALSGRGLCDRRV